MDNRSIRCRNCGGWLEFDAANGEFIGCATCNCEIDVEHYNNDIQPIMTSDTANTKTINKS